MNRDGPYDAKVRMSVGNWHGGVFSDTPRGVCMADMALEKGAQARWVEEK